MKLFGARRERKQGDGLLQARWFRALLTLCAVLVVLAVCIEVYRRAVNFGAKVVEAHPVDARIMIANPPRWLDAGIIEKHLLKEAYDFAQRDETTYHRCRNLLDNDVLREIADLYTGTETVDGKAVSRQTVGFNAWIKKITAVKRNVAADQSRQVIEIYAEWRSPAVWVRANKGTGDMLYLLDAEGVRLPGDYPLSDRGHSKLMVITGIDLPIVNGQPGIPPPGAVWMAGKSGAMGDDLKAGMALVKTLQAQMFAHQIDAVDLVNFNGRKDARASWILLDTIWQTASGTPRVIQWGRPVGQETFYEVKASAKLEALNTIYQNFKRIDAGRDYVDIRTEVVKLPKLATQADEVRGAVAIGG